MARLTEVLDQRPGSIRVLIALAVGAVVAFVAAWFGPWQLTILIGWDTAAMLIVATVWFTVHRFTPAETAVHATREDSTRTETQLLLLCAAVVSLGGVLAAFLKAGEGDRVLEPLLTVMAVVTIASSWALVHTIFALRYARIYYTEPRGGIDFKQRQLDPDYIDFAYTAFTVGMTFQVSDTDVTQPRMRRSVLQHSLVAFLFGAVILATMVNVVAGLLNS